MVSLKESYRVATAHLETRKGISSRPPLIANVEVEDAAEEDSDDDNDDVLDAVSSNR